MPQQRHRNITLIKVKVETDRLNKIQQQTCSTGLKQLYEQFKTYPEGQAHSVNNYLDMNVEGA